MKINVKNLDKLDKAFTVANGKCTARLADSTDVFMACERIENSLTEKGIPKCMWAGMKFAVQPGTEKLPTAYYKKGFSPEATLFILERGASAWFVTRISRAVLKPHKITMATTFTEEQESAIISNAYRY